MAGRKTSITIIIALVLALCTSLSGTGQNNKYRIDDSCYPLYRAADSLLGTPSFQNYIDRLNAQAEKVGDDKALAMGSTLTLRNAIRKNYETDILVKYGEAKETALRTGYTQYYFYAYQLVSVYYYNKGDKLKGLDYATKMHDDAVKMDNDYGKWMSSKYLADLYLADFKRDAAVKAFNEVIGIYETTKDPTIKAQSMTKVYATMATITGYRTQSFDSYMGKALETSKISIDTLLVNYCLACNAILGKDRDTYVCYRDKCLSNSLFDRAKMGGRKVFEMTDKAIEGDWQYAYDHFDELENLDSFIFISELAAAYDCLWMVRDSYDFIARKVAYLYEEGISQAMKETEVMLENDVLNNSLIEQKTRTNRFLVVFVIFIVIVVICAGILYYLYVRQLKKAKSEADRANRMKTDFLQNMSHEIRTPLNAVVGFSQLIAYADGTLTDDEKDEYISYITNNSTLLMMLIDDILDLSDIQSGNYRLSITECNCNEICRMALKTIEYRMPFGVRSTFVSDVPENLTISSDERRVQQILINFLTNSCKHTTEGEITLRCSTDIRPGHVTFAVQDTGDGIPAEKADTIFRRYSKLDDVKQGSGLGLNICMVLSEKLGGIVELDKTYGRTADENGKGARFYLHLVL
ncbi:MAG: sensor histidine kinase [Candidatus Cryptobacteroides sp.]